MSWFLIFSAAIFVDLLQMLLEWLAVGIIFGRVVNLLATASFAFVFTVMGLKDWMFPLFGLGIGEEVPFIGDILMMVPGEWLLVIWRIYTKNRPSIEETTEENQSEGGGEKNTNENEKEEAVAEQQAQDSGLQEQEA